MKESLLDRLAARMGCTYLSDLHWLDRTQKAKLASVVWHIEPEDATLFEWNDALLYLAGDLPAETAGGRTGKAAGLSVGSIRPAQPHICPPPCIYMGQTKPEPLAARRKTHVL